jgi:hypothetical protein
MEIRFFQKLTPALAKRVNQFRFENFYTEEERTPENLAEEEESF